MAFDLGIYTIYLSIYTHPVRPSIHRPPAAWRRRRKIADRQHTPLTGDPPSCLPCDMCALSRRVPSTADIYAGTCTLHSAPRRQKTRVNCVLA